MIESRTTRSFRNAFAALPDEIQAQARNAERIFRANPAHPSLRFKKVDPGGERVFGSGGTELSCAWCPGGSVVTWFWIGSHSEYDRLV